MPIRTLPVKGHIDPEWRAVAAASYCGNGRSNQSRAAAIGPPRGIINEIADAIG